MQRIPAYQQVTSTGITSIIKSSTYPAKGLAYFMATPSLWRSVICHFLFAIVLVIIVLVCLLIFALPAQALLLELAIPTGWAWFLSVLFVIIEISISTLLIGLIYLQEVMLDNLFDIVMEKKGYPQIPVKVSFARSFRQFMHPILFAFSILFFLPLNLIPIIGTFLFVMMTSRWVAWGAHMHWFDVKGMDKNDSTAYIKEHWNEYVAFGWTSSWLETIPLFGLFFMMTNRIGSALWAVDLEEAGLAPPKVLIYGN